MSDNIHFTTPAQAVRAMADAGAVFTVHRRKDGLSMSFTYRVADGGDLDRCRQILAHVKSKPPQFFQAFRVAIQDSALGGVSTPPTRSGSEGEAQTPPSTVSSRSIGGAGAPSTSADAEGGAETPPSHAGRGAA